MSWERGELLLDPGEEDFALVAREPAGGGGRSEIAGGAFEPGALLRDIAVDFGADGEGPGGLDLVEKMLGASMTN